MSGKIAEGVNRGFEAHWSGVESVFPSSLSHSSFAITHTVTYASLTAIFQLNLKLPRSQGWFALNFVWRDGLLTPSMGAHSVSIHWLLRGVVSPPMPACRRLLIANEMHVVCVDFCDVSGTYAPTRRVAPRLFCDICDMFDLHDTDDCPVQASSSSPVPTNHQPPHSVGRPYCNVCEGNVRPVTLLSYDALCYICILA